MKSLNLQLNSSDLIRSSNFQNLAWAISYSIFSRGHNSLRIRLESYSYYNFQLSISCCRMKQLAPIFIRLFHQLQHTPTSSTALWYPHIAEGPLLVTGASGPLAQLVLSDLLDTYHVPPRDIIPVTRSVHKLRWLRQRGVEVRFGDFDRPKSLPTAFSGG